jgi:hypothetical protein
MPVVRDLALLVGDAVEEAGSKLLRRSPRNGEIYRGRHGVAGNNRPSHGRGHGRGEKEGGKHSVVKEPGLYLGSGVCSDSRSSWVSHHPINPRGTEELYTSRTATWTERKGRVGKRPTCSEGPVLLDVLISPADIHNRMVRRGSLRLSESECLASRAPLPRYDGGIGEHEGYHANFGLENSSFPPPSIA